MTTAQSRAAGEKARSLRMVVGPGNERGMKIIVCTYVPIRLGSLVNP